MYIDLRHCRIRENVYRFTTLPNKGDMYIDLRHCRIRENVYRFTTLPNYVYRFTTLPNKGECISIYDIA